MGECGCGSMNPIAAYKVGRNVLVIDEYWGCKDCDTPIGITLHIFSPSKAAEVLDRKVTEKFQPEPPTSWSEKVIGFIGEKELLDAAEKFEDGWKEYDTFRDFLCDFGLEFLQEAMKKRKFNNGNLR